MKIVYAADLHGLKGLYSELLRFLFVENGEALILGGDLLPEHDDFEKKATLQREFTRFYLGPWLEALRTQFHNLRVFIMLGNDDWRLNLSYLETLESKDVISVIHGKVHQLGREFEVIGYSNVPPTPFSIKDHERIDIPGIAMEPQPDVGIISTGSGLRRVKTDHFFQSHPTMESEIRNFPLPVSFANTIYAMHAPPRDTKLDVLYDGRHLGSWAIRSFIEEHQPLLTLHGHIHESPRMSGTYFDYIGKTLCINPGRGATHLHAVALDLNDVRASLIHTVYGKAAK